jgi:membrane protease YdiL (CAAX protease family)
LTRTATYGFLAALPLFVLYEVLILIVNEGEVAQIRVGADVWIKYVLASLGGTGAFSLGILVIAVGLLVFLSERKKKIPIHPEYFAGLIAESFLYAVVVAILVSNLVGFFFSAALVDVTGMAGMAAEIGTAKMLVLSIGAGLYEELIFRVLLVGGLFWIFRQVFKGDVSAYMLAALIGALAFSAVHYIGELGDPFEMSSFIFRFLFGLALNAIFLVRGFGLAAWTHALYDVLIVTQLLG